MTMFLAYATMGLLMFVGILLMIVILLQRGRGGGLAGAFGGAGGQSAFGTRAGDVFTKITAVMAIIWVFLAGVSRFALEPAANQFAAEFRREAELEREDNPGGTLTTPPGETVDEGEAPLPPDDAPGAGDDTPAGADEENDGEAATSSDEQTTPEPPDGNAETDNE